MRPAYRADEIDEVFPAFAADVGNVPHADYLEFMRQHNGCDGPVGREGYICIWPLEDVILQTEAFRKAESQSKLLLFAGDGGDTAYAFDRADPGWPIIALSLTSISPEDRKRVASTFSEFVKRLAADEL